LKRKQIKTMLRDWEQRIPGCTDSIFAALANVAQSLLLDRTLFDFAGLRATTRTPSDGQAPDHPATMAVLK
jgi:tRNA 2-thiocytidine biosynthesis protein TtcA